jgi:hypothetical protein
MLSEVFGYDKYSEITSECSIRGTWCDLAIKIDGTIEYLIEVKAIGLDLKDSYTKQAVDYSANQGTDWVILTNAEIWRIYKITFGKPIDSELVLEINFSDLNPKKSSDLELVYNLTRRLDEIGSGGIPYTEAGPEPVLYGGASRKQPSSRSDSSRAEAHFS